LSLDININKKLYYYKFITNNKLSIIYLLQITYTKHKISVERSSGENVCVYEHM